jgi:site-specific DNA recombinase
VLARRLAENPGSTLEDVAAQENMGGPYAARLIRLNYLVPDIVAAIVDGKHPVDLTANKLMAGTRFPFDWRAQRAASDSPDRVHPPQSPDSQRNTRR